MRNFLFGALIFLIMSIFFLGCNHQRTLSPHHWVALGGEFDSLTNKLEWQFNDFAPFDSIRSSIESMDSLSMIDTVTHNIKKSRSLYWKSRFMERLEKHDSSIVLAQQALELNDSVNYRYDRLRIMCMMCLQSDHVSGATQYRHYEECLKFARESNDKAFEAYVAILMGNLMNEIGEREKAMSYYLQADSLNNILGYDKLVIKNKINEATILRDMGKKNVGDSILISLFGHPLLKEDTFAMNLLPRNLYDSNNEIKYLYQANDQIKHIERFRDLRGLYSALLLRHNYDIENFDSVVYYANLTYDDLPFVSDYNFKAIIWHSLSLAWTLTDRIDSAYLCRLRYERCIDSISIQRNASEVLRLSALQEMAVREAEYEAATFKRNMVTAFVILAILASGVVVALMLNRRHMRQKMRAMANELELEKTKRKVAATVLSIEEKDKVLDTLRSELSDMRKDGEIKEGNARRLESTIKSHLLEHDSEETFREMFDAVNPGFTEKLRELCPDLADSYVKLACYMLMELDNKRIASLMMIKPESVRQSRWRLSQRLHVPEEETLESFLRNLNKSCGIERGIKS